MMTVEIILMEYMFLIILSKNIFAIVYCMQVLDQDHFISLIKNCLIRRSATYFFQKPLQCVIVCLVPGPSQGKIATSDMQHGLNTHKDHGLLLKFMALSICQNWPAQSVILTMKLAFCKGFRRKTIPFLHTLQDLTNLAEQFWLTVKFSLC